jgi:hypothetical protein
VVTHRAGHSLPELIVTITFLTAALAGVGASSLMGARWATAAVRQQEGVRLAGAILDSLVWTPSPATGSRTDGPWDLRWEVDGPRIVVTAGAGGGTPVVELEGRRAPLVPVLPDDTIRRGGP